SAEVDEVVRARATADVDVLQEARSDRAPPAPPGFDPVGAVVGAEEEGAPDPLQLVGVRVAGRIDVLDEFRPGSRPVTRPELVPRAAVVRREQERSGDV